MLQRAKVLIQLQRRQIAAKIPTAWNIKRNSQFCIVFITGMEPILRPPKIKGF